MFPPRPPAPETDDELVRLIGEGNQPAFMAIYARYGSAVYGLVLRIVELQPLAEEVTQDLFLKLWQQPEKWNPERGRFPAWLMTSARNAAIDRLRRERRHRLAEPTALEIDAENLSGEESPMDAPQWAMGHDLRALVATMSPEQQRLLDLAYYKGYTHSDLARVLGMPLGTVKTRLRAAIIQLRGIWHEAERGRPPE